MCDTIIATADATHDGIPVFGKNSDREPNEAQFICQIPAREYPDDSFVQCTYICIPQVKQTHAVLLSRPFWMWGAEMGSNEHGLVIGNEAVFTRIPYEKSNALTGMDLLRLALERAETAGKAVSVITSLIETYGQGGNCGYQSKMFYHNSFILADPGETWVLETAGKHWAARKINGVYAISNRLSIENEWDLASDELVSYAIGKGWCRSESDFSFARCYSDLLYTGLSSSKGRRERAMALLQSKIGRIQISDIAAILRDHGHPDHEPWRPDKGLIRSSICCHAGGGPVRISQTTGSMISHLTRRNQTHFVTGTAAPCTSIFKPVWLDTPFLPDQGEPSRYFDETKLFWQHELLHRTILKDYPRLHSDYAAERDRLENQLFDEVIRSQTENTDTRSRLVQKWVDQAGELEEKWIARLQAQAAPNRSGWLYSASWKKHNKISQTPV